MIPDWYMIEREELAGRQQAAEPPTEQFTLPEILAAERIALIEAEHDLVTQLDHVRSLMRDNDLKLRHIADQHAARNH